MQACTYAVRMEENFGSRLRRIRKARRIAMKELARVADRTESWVSNLEKGKIDLEPSYSVVVQWAQMLGVTPEALTGKEPITILPQPLIDERTRRLAEIGERVVEVVRQSPLHIVPSAAIDPVDDDDEETVDVPVYAAFAADLLQHSERQIEERMRVPKRLWQTASDPLLILITGNCLMRKGIIRGDYVIVDASKVEPRTGDLVAFRFQGNESVKVFRRDGETIYLEPTVDEYQPIVVRPGQESDLEIVGVVTAWWDYAPRV